MQEAPPLDVIAECIDCVANDLPTLLSVSLTSYAVRRLCYKHLFRKIHYCSGFERPYSLHNLNEDLENFAHLWRHVREFVVAPQRRSFWGLFTATRISPCTLWRILDHFPHLTVLTLCSFNLVPFTHAGPCVSCPPLPECSQVLISRVLVGPECGLDNLAQCFRSATSLSVRYVFLKRQFPCAVVPTWLPSHQLRQLSIDLPMDSGFTTPRRPLQSRNDQGHCLWYNMWGMVQTALDSPSDIEDLRVAWTLSIPNRGT